MIYSHKAGPLDNIAYILANKNQAFIIDPAWEVPVLRRLLRQHQLILTGILLTHEHFDHVIGVPELLSDHPDIPVYISAAAVYTPPMPMKLTPITSASDLRLGDMPLQIIETPGHSPGGVCYKIGDQLITGDTVFINGCGRTDLPGSDPEALYHALFSVLWHLPDDTRLYPGHDYGPVQTDTWGNQKKTNPFLTHSDPLRLLKRL